MWRRRQRQRHMCVSIGHTTYTWTRLKFAKTERSASQSLQQRQQIAWAGEIHHDMKSNTRRIDRSSFKHQIVIGQKLVWTRRRQQQHQHSNMLKLVQMWRKHPTLWLVLATHSRAKHDSHKICARIFYNLLSINNIQHSMKYNVGLGRRKPFFLRRRANLFVFGRLVTVAVDCGAWLETKCCRRANATNQQPEPNHIFLTCTRNGVISLNYYYYWGRASAIAERS